MIKWSNLQSMIDKTFKRGLTKRTLTSRIDDNVYIVIENDTTASDGFNVIFYDGTEYEPSDREFVMIGKNLNEIEALELGLCFANYCRLF